MFELTNNHWLMLLLGVFILWYFYQMSTEGFFAVKYPDREQAGRRKWKYMYDWINHGQW